MLLTSKVPYSCKTPLKPMTRRSDLLSQLVLNPQDGALRDEATLYLQDLTNIALNGIETQGHGTLVVNLINDTTSFWTQSTLEADLTNSHEDREIDEYEEDEDEELTEDEIVWIENMLETMNNTNFETQVMVTVMSDQGSVNVVLDR